MNLADRSVIVTGASRGIGRAIALACAREGAFVGVNCHRSTDDARRVVEEAGRACLLPFDVADAEAVARAVDDFVAERGRLDAVVNNAGVPAIGLLATMDQPELERAIAVNFLGPMNCARAALPHFLARREGVILNIGSVAAERPGRGQVVYAASKGGIEAFTRALAVEYGRKGVRSVCLRLGPVDTRMTAQAREIAGDEVRARTPLGRFATPEEVAAAAVWLLSDAASFATGSVFTLDGGYCAG